MKVLEPLTLELSGEDRQALLFAISMARDMLDHQHLAPALLIRLKHLAESLAGSRRQAERSDRAGPAP
jgi:hypothetical protein